MRLIFFALFASAAATSAQPAIEWSRTYDGHYAAPGALEATLDGGAVFASTVVPGGVFARPLVVKVDAQGEVEWTWTGDRDGVSVADLVVLPDGQTVVLTRPSSLGGDASDHPALVWLGPGGALEAEVPIEVEGHDLVPRGLGPGLSGGVTVTGRTLDEAGESRPFLFSVLDEFGGPHFTVLDVGVTGNDVIALHGGGRAVFGVGSNDPLTENLTGFVTRVEERDDVIWTRTVEHPFLWVDAGVATASGGVTVVGAAGIPPGGVGAPVARLGRDGAVEWSRTVPVLEVAQPRGIANAPDGGFVVVGEARDAEQARDASIKAAFFAGLTAGGDVSWTTTVDLEGRDDAYAVARAADGGHFVAGLSGIGNGIPPRLMVWKLASQARRLSAPDCYDSRGHAPLVLRNDTDQPVVLDSLAFDRTDSTWDGFHWDIIGQYSDGTDFGAQCASGGPFGHCELAGSFRELSPGESVDLRLSLYCPSCRVSPDVTGVLEVYSGGDADAVRVRVEADIVVSVLEDSNVQPLALEVAPNPAATSAVLEVAVSEPSVLEVAVFDALGRRVAVLHDGPASTGTLRLEVDTSALPPGVYVVRASSRSAVSSVRLVVAR